MAAKNKYRTGFWAAGVATGGIGIAVGLVIGVTAGAVVGGCFNN